MPIEATLHRPPHLWMKLHVLAGPSGRITAVNQHPDSTDTKRMLLALTNLRRNWPMDGQVRGRRLASVQGEPIGIFRAIRSRDASALERDGQAFYSARVLREERTEVLYEVLFADGSWVIAELRDLDF